jgi:hypothetical protein
MATSINKPDVKYYIGNLLEDGRVDFNTLTAISTVIRDEAFRNIRDNEKLSFTTTADLSTHPINIIKDIKIINDSDGNPKVTKVWFYGEPDPVKVTLQEGDTFDIYNGVLLCYTKHIYGHSIESEYLEEVARTFVKPFKCYSKEIKRAIDAYYLHQKWEKEEAEEEAEKKRIKANQAAKRERYKVRRREKRIEEQAEAFKRAFADKNSTIKVDDAKALKKKRKLFGE